MLYSKFENRWEQVIPQSIGLVYIIECFYLKAFRYICIFKKSLYWFMLHYTYNVSLFTCVAIHICLDINIIHIYHRLRCCYTYLLDLFQFKLYSGGLYDVTNIMLALLCIYYICFGRTTEEVYIR